MLSMDHLGAIGVNTAIDPVQKINELHFFILMKRNFKISKFPPLLEKKHFPPTHEKYAHRCGLQ